MTDSSIFGKTELDYRRSHIRKSVLRSSYGRSRNPFVRRPAEKRALDG
ncbi:MAG: hypothetical protein Q7J48_04760 [Nocardioides sp.]|nr:hypothetical protein [Nocardioides sp.]